MILNQLGLGLFVLATLIFLQHVVGVVIYFFAMYVIEDDSVRLSYLLPILGEMNTWFYLVVWLTVSFFISFIVQLGLIASRRNVHRVSAETPQDH